MQRTWSWREKRSNSMSWKLEGRCFSTAFGTPSGPGARLLREAVRQESKTDRVRKSRSGVPFLIRPEEVAVRRRNGSRKLVRSRMSRKFVAPLPWASGLQGGGSAEGGNELEAVTPYWRAASARMAAGSVRRRPSCVRRVDREGAIVPSFVMRRWALRGAC